jgi:sec-independent protein translocase protein TatB
MLGMGAMEIAVILVIALLIFGPGKLPEIGQTLGRAVRDFRSATQDITGDFKQTMDELQETADDFKNTAMEFQKEAEDTFSDAQGSLVNAAKDLEDTTAETASEVNEGLSLDQMESPATRPSAKAEARISSASKSNGKSDSVGSSKKKPAAKTTSKSATKASASSSKKSASAKTNENVNRKTSSSRTKSVERKSSASRKQTVDDRRERPVRKRRERTRATVTASSAPSKDDPLADLMAVDDEPIASGN